MTVHPLVGRGASRAARRRLLVVLGTRPEAIKLAPLVRAARADDSFEVTVVATGQHPRMLASALEFFELRGDVEFEVPRDDPSLSKLSARILELLDAVLRDLKPDLVVVQGDTTTMMVAALAGFHADVPVAHVEAGLRTHDRAAPYPEEINRRLAAHLAMLHFAPTPLNKSNLLAEQVPESQIFITGNPVIDALLWAVRQDVSFRDERLARLSPGERILLVTAHRRESWGVPMESIATAVREIARRERNLRIVFPIHVNPTIRAAAIPHLSQLPNTLLLEPLPYGEFVHLMARSHLILTDSGGLQEEGPALGKPVLVMRDVTERPEAVASGTARIVGTAAESIVGGVRSLLHDDAAYAAMTSASNPYGDGSATKRILAGIRHAFGDGPRPADFHADQTSRAAVTFAEGPR